MPGGGVLVTIPGISLTLAQVLIAEVGVDMGHCEITSVGYR
ncbi:hypothetical protein EDD99_3629 [Streptomyces sp. 846.5]|nr:hypothetical protein [Streptomyces sp. 846.5]TDU05128.1 hypothetical protein EDD99_3629 [Streptomyces sp. 846.5]